MSLGQCWALNADRSRCEEPVADGECFCEEHDTYDGLDPLDIFCLPEAEMPPNLVAYIRSCCPMWPFPEASPPIVTFGTRASVAAPTGDAPASPERDRSPAAVSVASAAAPAWSGRDDDTDPEPLAWLLATLRQAIEEVMAADAKPLQKANTVARLGSLYLRTYRAAELTKENRHLRKQIAALEARLAAAEAPVVTSPARRKPPASANSGVAHRDPTRESASAALEPLVASPSAPALAHHTTAGGSRASP